MSECVCGKCPSTFKFSDGEDEEYLCVMSGEQLSLERRTCMEQIGKMCVYSVINTARPLTEDEKQFLEHNLKYWEARQKILAEEAYRRMDKELI